MKLPLQLSLNGFNVLLVSTLLLGTSAWAGDIESNGASSFLSVADNIKLMDKDKDGMVSTEELRAHLEAQHGKGYKKDVLDGMEASMSSRSCGSPFSSSFY